MSDLTPLNYDPANIERTSGFKVIPSAYYDVVIVDSVVKENKNNTGKILELENQIIDGSYVGDTVTDRINLTNPNEICQKIGQSELADVCDAVGHTGQLTDSNQLHGKPYTIKVVIESFQSYNPPYKELQSNKIEKRMALALQKKNKNPSGPTQQPSGAAAGIGVNKPASGSNQGGMDKGGPIW